MFTSISTKAQVTPDWQIGIGSGLVGFSDNDVDFIGDKHLDQIPRINVTKNISKLFSIDAAVSFGSFDSSTKIIAQNDVPYFSFDVSGRYKYYDKIDKIDPYLFAGLSMIDSNPDRSSSATINIGTGATYWFSKYFGINSQIYYKYSPESFESMRSHWQLTGGIVFGINGNSRSSINGSTRCYYDQHKPRR